MENTKFNLAIRNFSGEVECKVDVEANHEKVIPCVADQELNSKLKAIHLLIESIDVKHACDENYEIFNKVMLSILDSVGAALKVESVIDEHRNLQSVRYLVNEVFENNLFESPRYKGIFDNEEEV